MNSGSVDRHINLKTVIKSEERKNEGFATMIDRVDSSTINNSLLGNVQQTGVQAATSNTGNATATADVADTTQTLLDKVTISPEALDRSQQSQKVLQFTRLAQRLPEPNDQDKVAHFKDLVDSGRINQYLSSLNPTDLATELLNSSAGAFLRK